jgi:hypothetical protein
VVKDCIFGVEIPEKGSLGGDFSGGKFRVTLRNAKHIYWLSLNHVPSEFKAAPIIYHHDANCSGRRDGDDDCMTDSN